MSWRRLKRHSAEADSTAMRRIRRIERVGCLASLALVTIAVFTGGCVAPRLAPADLSEPGWQVQEVPAVWCPKRGAPELAGELLLASHPDGRRLVQFSKQSLPLVTAQVDGRSWCISSSVRSGRWGGSLPSTDRVPWFQFTELPPAAVKSARWQLTFPADGTWRVTRPGKGEFVEGVR